jgi:hypothetical protein
MNEQRIIKAKNLLINECKKNLFNKEYTISELKILVNRLNIKDKQAIDLVDYIFLYQYYLTRCAINGCNFNEEPMDVQDIRKRLILMQNIKYA